MGAQWKHAGKEQNASMRGRIISKLVKEITVAAKLGDPNPDNNPRLRAGVEAAKKASVTRDTIERAIKRGAGLLGDNVQYELVTYEGFAPHQVPVIVECLTENKNRTAAEVRVLFRKGQLGAVGSVAWMFDRLGLIEASIANPTVDQRDLDGVAIEAGADRVEPIDDSNDLEKSSGGLSARFYTAPADLSQTTKYLTDTGWTVTLSELSYVAKNDIDSLSGDALQEATKFLADLDENDDVHRIYTALKG